MTKCIVLGEEPTEELKPIEFVKCMCDDLSFIDAEVYPNDWANIELVSRGYSSGLDLIFAYDDDRDDGALYLGHWNGGVV